MKRVFVSVIFMIVFFSISIVYADAGLPAIKQYKAEISKYPSATLYKMEYNDNGANMVATGELNFGRVVDVRYDTTINGTKYISVYEVDEKEIPSYFNDGRPPLGYVKIDDINGITEGLSRSDYKLSDRAEKLTVLKRGGIDLYEWPAFLKRLI